MKHYQLIEHTDLCKKRKEEHKKALDTDNGFLFSFHNCHINNLVLFIQGEFIIIEYSDCIQGNMHHLDFKEAIIKKILKSSKKKLYYNLERSVKYGEAWKNEASREKMFNEMHTEINYRYSDNAGKDYCFATEYNFGSFFTNLADLDNEYNETIKYLKNYNLDLKEEVRDLYYSNYIPEFENNAVICKTIKELINKINKYE